MVEMSDSEASNLDVDCIGLMRNISRQESDESERELIITGYFRVVESMLGEELPMDIIVLVMLYF